MHTGRPVVIAEHGMVSTPHYLASAAGLRVLQEGGNAIDAAVAANAVLHVTTPQQCSPGGDAFWLIYRAAEGRLRGLNASGRAPRGLTPSCFHERGLDQIPVRGALPITVPGSVDGWFAALRAYGSLPMERLLAPAIHYAENGFAVNVDLARAIQEEAPHLRHLDGWRRIFLPSDQCPAVGERFLQPELGETLRAIATVGREAFYAGGVSQRMAESVQKQGGYLSPDDLAEHCSDWAEPLQTVYRGRTLYELPPNSRGAVALMALNILEGFDLASLGFQSPQTVYLTVEAYRIARQEFARLAGDTDLMSEPLREMLCPEYASELRARLMTGAVRQPAPPLGSSPGDTVYIAVVDADGNAVSLIDSTYYSFGSGLVAEGTGMTLQNRGACFSLDPAHPNYLQPRRRPMHTLMPAMAFAEGRPWLVLGSMGGDGQAQTQLQIFINLVDMGLNVQQAIEAPRWVLGGTLVGEKIDALRMESRFPQGTAQALEQRGHSLLSVGPWSDRMGVAQAICIDHRSGMLYGGADPRGEGLALGW